MTDTHPLLGGAVMYTLTDDDARQIIQRRIAAGKGTITGNDPRAGDVCPAVIVRVWADKFGQAAGLVPHVNLQVLLDGNDSYWATSRSEFDPSEGRHGRYAERYDSEAPASGPATARGPWVPDPRGHWTRA